MFLSLSKSFFIKAAEAHNFPKLNPWCWSEDAATSVHVIYPVNPSLLNRQVQSKWEN